MTFERRIIIVIKKSNNNNRPFNKELTNKLTIEN